MDTIKVVHIISSLGRGGRERQLATIYKYSDKEKIKTKIICFTRFNNSYVDEYNMGNDVFFLTNKTKSRQFFEIKKIIQTEEASIVWTWGSIEASYGVLLSLIPGVKHINGSIRHGIVRFNKHQLWRLLVLHLSKNIVANSFTGLRANLIKRGRVLRNGIDNNFFIRPGKEGSLLRKEFGINNDTILLTSIANLVPYKDYDTVLNALNRIKIKGIQFHYLAIGEGSERKRIEELAESLNLSTDVSFPGYRTGIKDILYSSDIFIHSSLGEGCSNAILEAMAAGLPIIASDTGGTKEIVDSSIGRLFEFQNVEQLENTILELISNKSLRAQLAENSKKKALSDFSIERMISDYYKIIEEVEK